MGLVIASALFRLEGKQPPHNVNRARTHVEGDGWAVGWLAGHAYELLDVSEYKAEWKVSWQNLPLPIIPRPFKFKPIEMEHIIAPRDALTELIRGASSVVIATDAGQEGQIIAQIFLNEISWSGQTYRLWSSANDVDEMVKSLRKIESNDQIKYQGLERSGMARLKADWLIGINFTVAYTRLAQKAGYSILASAGRVQSTVLAICVDHEDKVLAFQSGKYFELQATLQKGTGEQFTAKLEIPEELLDGDRCTDSDAIHAIYSQLSDQPASVKNLSEVVHEYAPPSPFNLTDLCIFVGRATGLSAHEIAEKYQSMYENGYLTYTRTEDNYYENEQLKKIPAIFRMLSAIPELADLVANADTKMKPPSFDSSKIAEHPANSPTTKSPDWAKLDGSSKQIYITVARRLISQFYPKHVTKTYTARLEIGGYTFTAKGKAILEEGWCSVEPHQDDFEIPTLPPLATNEPLKVVNMEVLNKKTRAPARMTESRLLEIMQNASPYLSSENIRKKLQQKAELGTSATRPAMIETLVKKRKYLHIAPDKTIRPTKTGRQVRALLPRELTTPDLTALWEIAFQKIRKGEQDPAAFLSQLESWLSNQIAKTSDLSITRNPMSEPCPKCESAMTRRESTNTKGSHYWMCVDAECRHSVMDDGGKPVVPLAGDSTPCPHCGEPFNTLLRKRSLKDIAKQKRASDRRFLMCKNKHFPDSSHYGQDNQ